MCVPLYGSHNILGVIYVDSDEHPSPFTVQHLHLLTALGLLVGMAVEDTRLYEDKIAQERLCALEEAFASINHTLLNVLMGVSFGVDLVEGSQESQDWTGWNAPSRCPQFHGPNGVGRHGCPAPYTDDGIGAATGGA
jgi:hypothetical protein